VEKNGVHTPKHPYGVAYEYCLTRFCGLRNEPQLTGRICMKTLNIALALLVGSACATAQNAPPAESGKPAPGWPDQAVVSISPVYSQLVAFMQPKGFVPAFEEAKGGYYLREAVLRGETVERWSQMLTLSGMQGLAANPQATPRRLVEMMSAGFKRSCPSTHTFAEMGDFKVVGAQDAFAALIGCGKSASPAGLTSEAALVVAIKGERDLYTVQWAQRGEAVEAPLVLDRPLWSARLQALMPIRVCTRVPGEAPPFPSCLDAKP
jgi:hypothetical protein